MTAMSMPYAMPSETVEFGTPSGVAGRRVRRKPRAPSAVTELSRKTRQGAGASSSAAAPGGEVAKGSQRVLGRRRGGVGEVSEALVVRKRKARHASVGRVFVGGLGDVRLVLLPL